MEHWIIPCNPKYYDVIGAFNKLECLDWKQSVKSIDVGDEVFIYVGAPIKAVKFRCKVTKTNLPEIEIDDSDFVVNGEPYQTYGNHMELALLETFDDNKYSLEILRSKGLKSRIQGPLRANGLL